MKPFTWTLTPIPDRPPPPGRPGQEDPLRGRPLRPETPPPGPQENPAKIIPWANKFFTGNPDNPPPVILQDFGVLPKGTVKAYRFQMTNIYAVPMQVKEPQADCGCVSVLEYTGQLGPTETGHIDIKVNTSAVEGEKTIKIPVEFRGVDPKTGNPVIDPKTKLQFKSQAELVVRFVSRPEIEVKPGAFEFGQVPAGQQRDRDRDDHLHRPAAGLEDHWRPASQGPVRRRVGEAPGTSARGGLPRLKLTLKLGRPPGRLRRASRAEDERARASRRR